MKVKVFKQGNDLSSLEEQFVELFDRYVREAREVNPGRFPEYASYRGHQVDQAQFNQFLMLITKKAEEELIRQARYEDATVLRALAGLFSFLSDEARIKLADSYMKLLPRIRRELEKAAKLKMSCGSEWRKRANDLFFVVKHADLVEELFRSEEGVLVEVDVEKIEVPEGYYPRLERSEEAIERYMEAYSEKREMPPIELWDKDGVYWLADGYHRLEAQKRLGYRSVRARVRKFHDELDFFLFCIRTNASHGMPLRREERKLLAMKLFSHYGLRPEEIARSVGVSLATVYRWTQEQRKEEKESLRDTVLERVSQGESVSKLAQELNVSKKKIYTLLQEKEEEQELEEEFPVEEEVVEIGMEEEEGEEEGEDMVEVGQERIKSMGADLLSAWKKTQSLEEEYRSKLRSLMEEMKRALGEEKSVEIIKKLLEEVCHVHV